MSHWYWMFSPDGTVWLGERDVTNEFRFWDAGTEVNEAPGIGPNQAPRQAGPDTGAAEGVVHLLSNTTRGLPLANGVAEVSVTPSEGSTVLLGTSLNVLNGRRFKSEVGE